VVSPTDVIAATFPYNIWRLEGTATAWRSMDAPADMLVADFWGSGPSDLFAAGNAGPATILRFDGTSWEKAWQGSSGAFVQGIWGCGPSDVHAVGTDGLVIALQGTQWQTLPPPGNPTVGLWSVWSPCDGSGDYFAVGRDELVYRGAGSSWTPIPTPEDRDLFGVYGLGPTEVWAVGGGVVLRFAASGFVEQLDPGGTMHNIWAASSTELYVLGPAGFLHTADGTSWTTPAPPPALTSWVDVQGVPGSAVFAASYGGAQLLVHPLQ